MCIRDRLITLAGILLLPVVPMAYAALVSMIFMRLGKVARNKSVLTTLGTILLLIAAMGVGMLSSQMENMDAQNLLDLLMAGRNSLVGILSKLFPNLRFLVEALVGGAASVSYTHLPPFPAPVAGRPVWFPSGHSLPGLSAGGEAYH